MSLAERLDIKFAEIVELQIHKDSTVDIVHLEALDARGVDATGVHPVDDLLSRPTSDLGLCIVGIVKLWGCEGGSN